MTGVDDGRFRSVAQLDMLHSLAAKLNALGDVSEIGAAITAELRTIIDYHNCRVYLIEPDGVTLMPIAFRGELFHEYEEETLEELITQVGEGLTGHVAATGESLLTPNAQEVEFSIQIEGTDDIVESMLLVPMKLGDQVTGVIVLSSLGYGKFDEEDRRLLEVLASHAAVAFENATLLQAERRAAETSAALLRLSQALTRMRSIGDVLQEALETIPSLAPCAVAGAYVLEPSSGAFRLVRLYEVVEGAARARAEIADVAPEVVDAMLLSDTDPFVIDRAAIERAPARAVHRARAERGPRRAVALGSRGVRGARARGARGFAALRGRGAPDGAAASRTSRPSPWATRAGSPSSSGSTSSSRASTRSSGRPTPRPSRSPSSAAGPRNCSGRRPSDGRPSSGPGARTSTRRIAAMR